MKKLIILILIICMFTLTACSSEEIKIDNFKIEVDKTEITLVAGGEFSTKNILFNATNNGVETSFQVESSDKNVATYQNGVVTGLAKGEAVITATAGDKSATCKVNVLESIEEFDFSSKADVNWYGRVYEENDGVWFDNTASGFEVNFIGTTLSAKLGYRQVGCLKVIVDGVENIITLSNLGAGEEQQNIELTKNLEKGLHTVKVLKMTEQGVFKSILYSLECDGNFVTPNKKPTLKFEIYGDSITCGYGNLMNKGYKYDQDGTNTYATQVANHYGAEVSCISYSGLVASLPVAGVNYTCYDIFSTYSEKNRTKWDFSQYQADVVIVNLGTNDSNMIDKSGVGKMIDGYEKLINGIRKEQPNATIFCVYGMMGVNTKVEDSIIEAVNNILDKEKSYLYYFRIDANDYGKDGHPDEQGHKMAASKIIEIIDRFCNLENK